MINQIRRVFIERAAICGSFDGYISLFNVEKLCKLGIDEISLVKGQGKFIVVLVDLETHKLVRLVPARKQSEIEKMMKKWGEKVLSQIEEVGIDMTGNYKSLVKKLCPNAEITVDRFHVTKMIHDELNQARIDQKKSVRTIKRWFAA